MTRKQKLGTNGIFKNISDAWLFEYYGYMVG